jgi:hypothetical protein
MVQRQLLGLRGLASLWKFKKFKRGRCGEPTGVSSKLRVWVWHSPKPQKGASIVMPNKSHAWAGTASDAEVGKMQYCCFFLRCLHSERNCHRFLLFPRITMSSLIPRELPLHLMLPLYIINSLEVEGVVVSPPEHPAYLAPALCMFGLLSVVFYASPVTSVRFLGQVFVAC